MKLIKLNKENEYTGENHIILINGEKIVSITPCNQGCFISCGEEGHWVKETIKELEIMLTN